MIRRIIENKKIKNNFMEITKNENDKRTRHQVHAYKSLDAHFDANLVLIDNIILDFHLVRFPI